MFVCDSQLRFLRVDVLLNWEAGAAEEKETTVSFARFDRRQQQRHHETHELFTRTCACVY